MGCGASKREPQYFTPTKEMGAANFRMNASNIRKSAASNRSMTRQLSSAALGAALSIKNAAANAAAAAASVIPGADAVAPAPIDPEILAKDEAATAEIPSQLEKYIEMVRCVTLFSDMGEAEVEAAAREVTIRHFKEGDIIYTEGDSGHECWILEEGKCAAEKYVWSVEVWNKKEWKQTRTYKPGKFGSYFGERALSRAEPRQLRIKCLTDCKVVRLSAHTYVTCARIREYKEKFIRGVRLFETMTDEQVIKLGALMHKRTFKDGESIVREGDAATHFYLLEAGDAVETRGGKEVKRISAGEIFAEIVLTDGAPHATSIAAMSDGTEAYEISKADFEARLGQLEQLQAEQYAADPRKLLSDFYQAGDGTGPAGLLNALGVPKSGDVTSKWFAVYRPCSRDSIAKMLGTTGVGKGLNIKGKSAKKGRLSGFVPFLQVSDNKHKPLVEQSPKEARTHIYYRNVIARQTAEAQLQEIMRESDGLEIEERVIRFITDYEPHTFGLDIPEAVVREAYIMRPDITQVVGWETGRASEPAFMDMNLHSVRGDSMPNVVLYQFDLADPMNPLGLLIAYSEAKVKPVCSDFDTFTVGSRGVPYEPLPSGEDGVELVNWCLTHAEKLIAQPTSKGWMSRWLGVIKEEAQKGFHPALPKYGFGDPSSLSLIGRVVEATASCGAVRHGAECFNFYFPQDLDDEFLVVWDGFENPPWKAFTEPQLRTFLLERCKEGYSFPINPVWPIRDKGWFDVLKALQTTAEGRQNLASWFPPGSGIVEKIEKLHAAYPDGFKVVEESKAEKAKKGRLKSTVFAMNFADLSTCEMADYAVAEARGEIKLRWQRARNAFAFSNLLSKMSSKNLAGGESMGES